MINPIIFWGVTAIIYVVGPFVIVTRRARWRALGTKSPLYARFAVVADFFATYHVPAALAGLVMLQVARVLRRYEGVGFDLLFGFLIVTAFQILLWCIGIRLEVLGNTSTESDLAELSQQTFD